MGKTCIRSWFWIGGVLMILILIFQWSNIIGYYSLPSFPGLRRLGASIFSLFTTADTVVWLDESTVIYLSPEFRRGFPSYALRMFPQFPTRIFPNFYLQDLSVSSNHQVAFIDPNKGGNELWVSKISESPKPVSFVLNENQSLLFLDWNTDGKSLIVDYFDSKKQYIGEINLEDQRITKLYTWDIRDDPIDGIDVSNDHRVVYVTRNHYGKISILDLKQKQVEILDFGSLVFSRIQFLKKQPWLIGLVAGEDGEFSNKIALINPEEDCMVTPFDSLTGIRDFDVYETEENIKLILVDEHRLLYILDFSQALGENLLSSMFSCNQ